LSGKRLIIIINMPNQNPTNTNDVAPVFFPQTDLPPLPPEFQNINTTKQTPLSLPKKKFGTKKIIATILGFFVLVGGVGAAILTTQQKQLLEQKAQSATCSNAGSTENCYGKIPGDSCTGGGGTCILNANQIGCTCGSANNGGTGADQIVCAGNTCSVGNLYNPQTCFVTHFGCEKIQSGYNCASWILANGQSATFNQTCGGEQIDVVGCGFCDAKLDFNCTPRAPYISTGHTNPCLGSPTPTPIPTDIPTVTPSPTPTATPIPTDAPPSCVPVKAYDASWNLLTSSDLALLTAGNNVNFCVGGAPISTDFDKAQFMINSAILAETTTKRPNSDEYCQNYTIGATDSTVTVKAKIHHIVTGWVGEIF